MPLTNQQKYELIREREERKARVRRELQAGTRHDPPPLLVGLEPVSAILPRLKLSPAQKRRNTQDAITTLERMLCNPRLTPAERKKLEDKLRELRA